MNLLKSVFVIALVIIQLQIHAQEGIALNTPEALRGYALVENFSSNYLVDNCGKVVHEWSNVSDTDLHAKLLPTGNLMYIRNNTIYETRWDGSHEVVIQNFDNNLEFVYEVIKLPNGNYLSLGRRGLNFSGFQDLGYPTNLGNPSVVDVVIELDKDSGEIVWEWNISDHVIQERDSTLPNYGKLSENPGKLNMDAISDYDWEFYESFMINGMDYNPELDQIALSVRKIGEVCLIDHSTTTEEAKGSTGGVHGKGGDIIYRWGNPQNYDQGTASDRTLYFQHNPNWILHGEHKGKMICYNNRLSTPWPTYSSAPIFDPVKDADGFYVKNENEAFMPILPELKYDQVSTGTEFYSGYTSAAKYLSNGTLMITEGVNGRIMEVDVDGSLLWEYIVPDVGYVFRTEKYALDYPAFDGQNFVAGETIEFPPSSYDCTDFATDVKDLPDGEKMISLSYVDDFQTARIVSNSNVAYTYKVYDANGKLLINNNNPVIENTIDLNQWVSGIYYFQAIDEKNQFRQVEKLLVP